MWRTLIVSLALICLVLLGWYAVRKFPGRIEADLQDRAQKTMTSRVPNVTVRAYQRDLVLTGVVADEATRSSAERLARELSGVRTVVSQLRVGVPGAPAPTPSPEPAPGPSPEPTPTDPAPEPTRADGDGGARGEGEPAVPPQPQDPPTEPPTPEEPADEPADKDAAAAVLDMDTLEPDEPAEPAAPAPAEPAAPEKPAEPARPDGRLTAAECRDQIKALIEGDNRITFQGATGKFTPEGEAKVLEVWAILQRCPEVRGTIEAYHDDYGDPDRLKTLTQIRAYNTHKKLVDLGMDPKRLRYVGLGYRNMRYGGGANRVLNQRVEFNLTVE